MKVSRPSSTQEVEIFRSDGGFRWRFVDHGEGRALTSNQEFGDLSSARRSARTAYPKLAVIDGVETPARVARRDIIVLVLLSVTVLGLLLVLLREA